jgi:ABC-type spermidine/putrescine transport system permease subunit II
MIHRSSRRASGRTVLYGFAVLIAAFLIAPLIIVVPMSFSASTLMQFPPQRFSLRWYESYFNDPAWLRATWVSVKTALLVATISVVFAIGTSIGLTRGRFAGRAVLQSLILSPLVVPVIILAAGLYYLYSFARLNGTLMGLVLGHIVLTFPYAVVVISASLEDLDPTFERAARGLGANPLRAFLRITLPLIGPAVGVAYLFCFLTSFDEVVLATFITGPETATLPRKMWDGIRFELNPTIAAVSTLLIGTSWALMLVVALLRRARRETSAENA